MKLPLFPYATMIDAAGHLLLKEHRAADLARQFGTPLYVYDVTTLRRQIAAYRQALAAYPAPVRLTYASKAFLGVALARLLAEAEVGLDVASAGEIFIARQGGVDPARMHLHSNNKTRPDLEMALAADFIVAADDAQLGLPEITLSAHPPYRPKITEDGDPDQPEYGGSAPGWGGVKRLPERVGKALAKELMFTGVRVDAARALQIGLVNAVFPKEEFEDQVKELANRIGAMNPYNLRLVKELVNHGYDLLEGHPS